MIPISSRLMRITSEQLAIIPRQHYVIAYKRAKYAAKNDEVARAQQGIRIVHGPDQIIRKSIAHSSVIADVVNRKSAYGLPLYPQVGPVIRLSQPFGRFVIGPNVRRDLSRVTACCI